MEKALISREAFVLKIRNNAIIKNMFKKAFTTWVTKSDGYYFECKGLLYEIFAQLQKNNYLPDYQFSLIKPAVDYIHNNFLNKRITAEDLCSCCTISYTYLKKLFVKCFGMPPLKYAINLKINYACDLLIYDQHSISEVSEMCGYKDVYFFSRQFKEYMGCSPTDYINKYKSSK